MTDAYELHLRTLSAPAASASAITPDDDNDLPQFTRAIYVGGYGDITLVMVDDTAAVTFTGVVQGTVLPVRAKRVMESTTATNLVALV